jgi:lipopolysaccharide biosynthesis regulator YciM
MSDDLDNDYIKIKKSLFDLSEQGDEAIELMMDVARESEHPRAFEVLGQLIKQNAEIGEKILKMHKTKKEVEKIDDSPALEDKGVTNNNVFIGSTTELQKLLHNEKVIDAEKLK